MVGRLHTKPTQRFDSALFFYVAALLVGSAVWLRLIPAGTLTGRGINTPLWLEKDSDGRSSDGRPLPQISGFSVTVDQDQCNFTKTDDNSGCGKDNPQIAVTATIQSHAHVARGMSLAVYSSNDFEYWRQANAIELPRDMFHTMEDDSVSAHTGPMQVIGALWPTRRRRATL